jgi:hypothetical protein
MKQLYFILCALLISGCDLFTTRSAETPSQSRSDYQQAVTPELLISNLVNSLTDLNVQNYLSCFSDSSYSQKVFTFSPASSALSQYPALSESWGKKNEESYFNTLKSKVTANLSITLTLSDVSESPQGDSLVYMASYLLNVPTNDKTLPPIYQGTLIFNMIRDSRSVWSIYYWQDSKASSVNLPSWSELKGRNY